MMIEGSGPERVGIRQRIVAGGGPPQGRGGIRRRVVPGAGPAQGGAGPPQPQGEGAVDLDGPLVVPQGRVPFRPAEVLLALEERPDRGEVAAARPDGGAPL